jgi:hypothetical protein
MFRARITGATILLCALELEALSMMKALVMKKTGKFRAGVILAGGIALLAGMAGEASAQFYPRPHVFGGYYGGEVMLPPIPRRPIGLGASAIMEELEERGFKPLGVVSRRPDVFVIDALDRRNQPVRLVVDAFDGEILERFARQDDRTDPLRAPAPDARRLDQLNKKDQAKTPKADTRIAEVPVPPRRPGMTSQPSSGPLPALRPVPVAPARDPSQWAPINTIPVAPLE